MKSHSILALWGLLALAATTGCNDDSPSTGDDSLSSASVPTAVDPLEITRFAVQDQPPAIEWERAGGDRTNFEIQVCLEAECWDFILIECPAGDACTPYDRWSEGGALENYRISVESTSDNGVGVTRGRLEFCGYDGLGFRDEVRFRIRAAHADEGRGEWKTVSASDGSISTADYCEF